MVNLPVVSSGRKAAAVANVCVCVCVPLLACLIGPLHPCPALAPSLPAPVHPNSGT